MSYEEKTSSKVFGIFMEFFDRQILEKARNFHFRENDTEPVSSIAIKQEYFDKSSSFNFRGRKEGRRCFSLRSVCVKQLTCHRRCSKWGGVKSEFYIKPEEKVKFQGGTLDCIQPWLKCINQSTHFLFQLLDAFLGERKRIRGHFLPPGILVLKCTV